MTENAAPIMPRPHTWPASVRIMLTAFLVMIGTGYLFALANVYHQHHMADGKEGLTIDDVRAAYSGLTINKTEETVIPSRMLTMLRTSMRGYVDDDADFNVLESWLESGGSKEGMTQGEGKRTPERALILHCMRCHAQNAEGEMSREAPFGPDDFTVDYKMIEPLVAPETSVEKGRVRVPPQLKVPHLVLVTHAHMLAIPIFTLLVGGLFAASRCPGRLRAILTPLPMLAVFCDFSSWWLARTLPGAVYLIVAAGGVFGSVFGIQIVVVLIDLWRPVKRSA